MWSSHLYAYCDEKQSTQLVHCPLQMEKMSDVRGVTLIKNFRNLADGVMHLCNYNPKQCPK